MKTVKLEIADRLYQQETGPEAQVGDQVKMFLDEQSNPELPEFIFGIIQSPIKRIRCEEYTLYSIEYDETGLSGNLLRPDDVISIETTSAIDVVANDLLEERNRAIAAEEAEEAARIEADNALDGRLDTLEADAVRYTSQTNSDARELQARTNVGLGVDVIDPINRTLVGSDTNVAVDWENRSLKTGGDTTVNWASQQLVDVAGNDVVLDWANYTLLDTGGTVSIQWAGRQLHDPDGVAVLSWSTPGFLQVIDGTRISFGTTTGTYIGNSISQKFAFHGSTPVAQRAGAAQAAVVTTASTQTTPWGFATQAQADALVTLVNELRAAMVEKGLIKGSA